MKVLRNILAILVVLMISIITFFSFNLLFSFVSNYASLSKTSFAFIPMMMFMCEIYVALFAIFNYVDLKRKDAYFWRKYSIMMGCFALVGFVFSIVVGTVSYGTFIGDYVFTAYPLIMLIVHTLLLAFSCYIAFISIRIIVKEKPEKVWKNKHVYRLKEFFIAQLLVFGMEKLGAFVLLPLFWSSYDSIYVLPFIIQLLMPIALFVTYMIDFHWKHSMKLNVILYGSILGYSLFSLIYMLIASHNNYPTFVNPLSPILQLERLITSPLGFVIMYLVCVFTSFVFLMGSASKIIVDKKKSQGSK